MDNTLRFGVVHIVEWLRSSDVMRTGWDLFKTLTGSTITPFPLSDQVATRFAFTAEKADGKAARWADAALLKLAARKVGAPEPREMATKALDAGWQQPKRRAQIIQAAADADDKSRATQIAAGPRRASRGSRSPLRPGRSPA